MNVKRLCPDCLLNYLESESEIHSGLCTSCSRRKRIMKTTGKEYKKFKDYQRKKKAKFCKIELILVKEGQKQLLKILKILYIQPV